MAITIVKIVRAGAVAAAAAGAALVAGCTPPPPPAPPPPPPPVQEAFPARPLAPGNAQDGLAVPPLDAMGVRQTVNAGLTSAQTVWNLRSAYNVAALNCGGPEFAAMAERYGAFLETHTRELSATNRALGSEFRQKYGPGYKDVQDRYMTQVYNYFALPPALGRFCPAALSMSEALLAAPKGELDLAAAVELPKLEAVFAQFYSEYEAYRLAATAWDARYLATYGEPYVRPTANPLAPAATVPYGPGAAETVRVDPYGPVVPGAVPPSQTDPEPAGTDSR